MPFISFVVVLGDHLDTIRLLLARDGGLETRSKVGKTPLHRSCEYGHKETVKLLLSYGADFASRDEFGRSPSHLAAMSMNLVREAFAVIIQ